MTESVPMRSAPKSGDAVKSWIRALDAIKILETSPETTLPSLLDHLADTHGERPALLDASICLSYRGLAERANRVARWAVAQGLGPGDVVCLLMPNCPDYVATWLGLTRIGCVVALINTHLLADALLHSLRIAASRHLIVAGSLAHKLEPMTADLPDAMQIWCFGPDGPDTWPHLLPLIAAQDSSPLKASAYALPRLQDRALLIYTSGTTGAPKAAHVTHARIVEWSFWFAGMMNAQQDDRLYDCLPMYHSVGGVVAVGAMLVKGGSVLIRPRFSASRFWDDVVDGGCTIFQYIGELCRYLTAGPTHPKQCQHRLRLACGNGLAGDIWTKFQERFAIPTILEFYAATEGSVSLYNCEGKPGAIGRVPAFLAHRFPVALIRCDPQTGVPLRDATGGCCQCDFDETGEAIGQISSTRRFDGYTDATASEKKILRNVFAPDDAWFRTGDLMRKDASGYYYFVDRVGETFRWKGENVATTEITAVLRACPDVTDAVVYGVAIPGYEGRAGMAAITVTAAFDLTVLHAHLTSHLPEYAQPLFVRICPTLAMTGTFKLTKNDLANEGYELMTDPVWFNDRQAKGFVAIEDALRRGFARL